MRLLTEENGKYDQNFLYREYKLERERERRWSGCRMIESKRVKLNFVAAWGYPSRTVYSCELPASTYMTIQTAQ